MWVHTDSRAVVNGLPHGQTHGHGNWAIKVMFIQDIRYERHNGNLRGLTDMFMPIRRTLFQVQKVIETNKWIS